MEILSILIRENLELLRVFWISMLGQIFGIAVCCIMMERRRSVWRLFVCSVVKLILVMNITFVLFDTVLTSVEHAAMLESASVAFINLVMVFIFVYTFQGGFVKVAIGIALVETILSVIMLPSVMIANLVAGKEDLFTFYGEFQKTDFLILICVMGMLWFIRKYASAILNKYRSFQFPYPKLFMILWMLYWGTSQLQSVVDIESDSSMFLFLYMLYLVTGFGIMIGINLMYWRYQNALQMESDYLNAQLGFLESHYETIRNQNSQIEHNQQLIDDEMRKIGERYGKSRVAGEYLDKLKDVYSNLNLGGYCSDVLIDAVLHGQRKSADENGIQTDYQLQGYHRGEIEEKELAKILLLLFQGIIEDSAERKGISAIQLKMSTVRNQLAILFCVEGHKEQKYFTEYNRRIKQIKKRVRGIKGNFEFIPGNGKIEIRILLPTGIIANK